MAIILPVDSHAPLKFCHSTAKRIKCLSRMSELSCRIYAFVPLLHSAKVHQRQHEEFQA